MSDNEFNWYVLIYPAIALPIALMSIVVSCRRWKRRQLAQSAVVAANANNGLTAQDASNYIMGNPHTNYPTVDQSATSYNREQPVVYQNTKVLFKHGSKEVQEEPPPMIQSKRWF